MTVATLTELGSFEHHLLPSGAEVFYRDPDHSYWRQTHEKTPGEFTGSGRLTGVSTVVKPFDWSPDNLMRWASRLTCEGLGACVTQVLADETLTDAGRLRQLQLLADDPEGFLERRELRWQDQRNRRAKEGTNVHEYVLNELANGRDPNLDGFNPDEVGMAQGMIGFWLDEDPEPIAAEQVVLIDGDDDENPLGVAGRFDLLAKCTRTLKGTIHVDAKTSGYISKAHHCQAAGYEIGVVECQLVDHVDASYLLKVDAQGNYQLLPVVADAEDFYAAVNTYRRAGRVEREARKQVAA